MCHESLERLTFLIAEDKQGLRPAMREPLGEPDYEIRKAQASESPHPGGDSLAVNL